jgi:hypothetical protein
MSARAVEEEVQHLQKQILHRYPFDALFDPRKFAQSNPTIPMASRYFTKKVSPPRLVNVPSVTSSLTVII